MKSSWDLHMEIEKRIKRLQRCREWIEKYGAQIVAATYFAVVCLIVVIGVFLQLQSLN